jgi:hypothetical protein
MPKKKLFKGKETTQQRLAVKKIEIPIKNARGQDEPI